MATSKVGEKRKKTGGRKAGTPNKTTGVLKDAIILAAENVGGDGAGKDGLVGYLTMVAKGDVKAFSGLLGRVLPMQMQHSGAIDTSSKEQRDAAVAAAMRADN